MCISDCALHPINNLGHMKVSHSLKANKAYWRSQRLNLQHLDYKMFNIYYLTFRLL